MAVAGLAAIFICALQWQPAGFAHIFGNGVLLALASLIAGLFFGFCSASRARCRKQSLHLHRPAPRVR